MSLFETLSEMSRQHAESAGDSGEYDYKTIPGVWAVPDDVHKKRIEEATAPTVSLYNLLDHSPSDLEYLLNCVRRRLTDLEPNKIIMPSTYAALCAWAAIIETAIKERQAKDSEAWAEKTANEILDNDNCGPEHNV